jgi:hypothetical protein
MLLVTDKPLTVFIEDGILSMNIPAGDPVEVPDNFVYAAMQAGALPVGAQPTSEPHPLGANGGTAELKVPAIIEAMRKLLESGNPEVLEAGGMPRVSEIDAIVGFRTNKADREAAWAVVEG